MACKKIYIFSKFIFDKEIKRVESKGGLKAGSEKWETNM
jgi:hypothetical protein